MEAFINKNSSLINPNNLIVHTRETDKKGIGVFASKNIYAGNTVLKMYGDIVDLEKVWDHARFLQVSDSQFLGPSGLADDYINHSCEPNCGIIHSNEEYILTALRDIEIGEEITFDYSTWMNNDYWKMECRCESINCRNLILDFAYLDIKLQNKYIKMEVVPNYVINSLMNRN
jgi:uncharacterized protein